MNNVILGSGASAYVIAACLDYCNQDFAIISSTKDLYMPPIMLLKCNESELELYKQIFCLPNISDFLQHIKIGYLFDGTIYDTMSDKMKAMYLAKQSRKQTSSSVSDSLSSFYALRLDKIVSILQQRYANKLKVCKFTEQDYMLDESVVVYDTMFPIDSDSKQQFEYIVQSCDIDLLDYDYVYDCNVESKVKRYSKDCTEYIVKPNCKSIQLANYYDEVKVYEYCNGRYVKLGRRATKTQMKQEDVIRYMLKRLNKGELL